MTVQSDAPIADYSLDDAVSEGILDRDALIVAIKRGDRVITLMAAPSSVATTL